MSNESKLFLDACAFQMLSNTYYFELSNPNHPSLTVLGDCRVVSIEIHETDTPALGLSNTEDEYVHIYSIHELSFSPALSIAV
jgi:hypothetical protein